MGLPMPSGPTGLTMAKRIGPALLLVLLTVLWFIGSTHQDVLRVHNAAGDLLLETVLPDGAEFGIRFTHSVARSPVEDWFAARDGKVALNRTVYQDFGAGLPHEAGTGQTMTFRDGHIEITGYNLALPQLDVRVGRVAGHELLLPGTDVTRGLPLDSLAPPGASLSFSIHTQSLAKGLWRQFTRVQRG